MVRFTQLSILINDHTKEFDRLYKCLNKKDVPKSPTKEKHISDLILSYNAIVTLILKYNDQCTTIQKSQIKERQSGLRKKLSKLFNALKVNINIPKNFDNIVINVVNTPIRENSSYDFDADLNIDNLFLNMAEAAALAKSQWINTYSKVIPEFDGTPESATRFYDACDAPHP